MSRHDLVLTRVLILAAALVAAAATEVRAQEPAPAPPQGAPLPAFIPPVTDEEVDVAFPDVRGHTVHDDGWYAFVLVDRLEWDGDDEVELETAGWVGGDINRMLFRVEGDTTGSTLTRGRLQATYARHVARWWDAVAGVEQDLEPGPGRTWALVGVEGLAPYWFDVSATLAVGRGGRTRVRLETEYDLLVTNRLVLQPAAEIEVYGKADEASGMGRGLSTGEVGFRLRYEIRRELAPYAGIVWHRRFFGTADAARARGEAPSERRFVFGLRLWM